MPRFRMGVLLNRPIYYILPAGQPWLGVYADDGRALAAVDATTAARVAGRHAPADAQPVLLGVVETIDQWTLTNSLNLHRPLYRFGLDDGGGTELYVSAKTGEMVMRTTRKNLLIPFAEPARGTIHRKGPFTTWNLRGRYELGGGLCLTGAVRNLLNKNDHPLFIAIA